MFGHVDMEEGGLVKKTTGSDVEGTRPMGKPHRGWMGSVKRGLDVRGMSAEQYRLYRIKRKK